MLVRALVFVVALTLVSGAWAEAQDYMVRTTYDKIQKATTTAMYLNRLAECNKRLIVYLNAVRVINHNEKDREFLSLWLDVISDKPIYLGESLTMIIDDDTVTYFGKPRPPRTLPNGMTHESIFGLVYTGPYGSEKSWGRKEDLSRIASASSVGVRISSKAGIIECQFHAENFTRFQDFVSKYLRQDESS